MLKTACLRLGQPRSVLGSAQIAAAGAVHVAVALALAGLADVLFNFGRAGAAEGTAGFGRNSKDCRQDSSGCDQRNADRAHQ